MVSFRAALLACALGLTVGGCAIPATSEPVKLGRAENGGTIIPGDRRSLPPAGRATSVADLARDYLTAAAAGDFTGTREDRLDTAATRARTFLTDEASRLWRESGPIIVVDVTLVESGDSVVARFHPIGELTEYGTLVSSPGVDVLAPHTFRAQSVQGEGLRLTSAPPGLLLSRDALMEYYAARPIYFDDEEQGTTLVPDLRYFALHGNDDKRRAEVIERLLAGPSAYLKDVVVRLPDLGRDNPFIKDGQIVVNLVTGVAPMPDVRRLAYQIRWSMKPDTLPLELRYNGKRQLVDSGTEYERVNAAVRTDPHISDEYVVHNGKAVAVPSGVGSVPVLDRAPENVGVVTAALSRDRSHAALVRRGTAPKNRLKLHLGRYEKDLNLVTYAATNLEAAEMSRPVWLNRRGSQVLVAADGQLFDVSESRGYVRLELSVSGLVTAVSVAPDDRHIAIVAGGVTYIGLLDYAEVAGEPVSVKGGLRRLYTGDVANHTGVAWTFRDAVVVAGSKPADGAALVQVSVDSGWRTEVTLQNLGQTVVTQVASVPRAPYYGNDPEQRGTIVLEATNRAYKVFRERIDTLGPDGSVAPFMLD